MPSGFGNVEGDGYQGTTSPYKIEGGKLIASVSQHPYAFALHKLGDTYYAARSNESAPPTTRSFRRADRGEPAQRAVEPVLDRARTDEQKKQIVSILQQEVKQLGELEQPINRSGG